MRHLWSGNASVNEGRHVKSADPVERDREGVPSILGPGQASPACGEPISHDALQGKETAKGGPHVAGRPCLVIV